MAVDENVTENLDLNEVSTLIEWAIQEDLGSGDLTSELLFPDNPVAKAHLISREEIVVCGMDLIAEILNRYHGELALARHVQDGQPVHIDGLIADVSGPLVSMLSAERVILNFLQRLCGIATTTYKYVQAIQGTSARIYDTRKTTPGWRLLEKYAVRCGGGYNHRIGLYDGVLIKDNHLAEMGSDFHDRLRRIIKKAREEKGVEFIAVEVDHVDEQLNYVLDIPGIDVILLDNMGTWQLRHAVAMRERMCGMDQGPLLEASGGITLDNVASVARCGVDRISIGAITHSAIAVDIGLDRK